MNYQMIRRSTDGLRHFKHSHQLRALMKRRDQLEKVANFQRVTGKRGEVTK